MRQGTQANRNGNSLQKFVHNRLIEKGYTFINKKKFTPACIVGQPIFTEQFVIKDGSIYNQDANCDFILYHPDKYPNCLVIECKWQQSNGSVDEKFPYVVKNVKERSPFPTIVIVDGEGYKPNSITWLKDQVDKKLIHVFTMSEFQRWSNIEGNL
jgi:hypothetical protein